MNPEEIRKRIANRKEEVYREMREHHNRTFRDVVRRSETLCLNNRIENSELAAEIETAMMLLAHELMS
jgi:hypothetical protein